MNGLVLSMFLVVTTVDYLTGLGVLPRAAKAVGHRERVGNERRTTVAGSSR